MTIMVLTRVRISYVSDDADIDAVADAGDETDMPTQGLPPLAMTGSIAVTKINS